MIDRTCVPDCTDPRPKLPAYGVWFSGEAWVGRSRTDRQAGRTGYQHLNLSLRDTVQTLGATGRAVQWVLRRR